MNNGLLNTLNTIIPLFEKMMKFENDYTARGYMKTIEIAMKKKYNVFSICLVFDLMLSAFLNECRISLVDLVLERDKDAVDCVAISKEILSELRKSGYYNLKDITYKKMKNFLDETYRQGTKIDNYFDKGEKLYEVIKFHFGTIDDMELHQFFKGAETDEKPLFIKDINCFRNMNEAVQVMNTIPVNFIALVGIKDENSNEHGYFSYLVKNGESLYALSDVNRSKGEQGIFSGQRNIYRDLMPYVHLREFQYAWYWTDAYGYRHPLNTDKYHVASFNRNWDIFTLNELEDDEILLQYFMFDYVNNLLFVEKAKVKELTYTTQTIALTYKGKTINKKQLPALANNMNSTEVPLPDMVVLFDETVEEMRLQHLETCDAYKKNKEKDWRIVCGTEREWKVKEQAIANIRTKLTQKPLDILFFEYDQSRVIKVSGSIEQLSNSWSDRLWGISSHFFGTEVQYKEYSQTLFKKNFKKMINVEYNKIIKEQKVPPFTKFLEYLISDKFKDLIIEKTLLDALSNQEFSYIKQKEYFIQSYNTNKSWEKSGGNIWIDKDFNWKTYRKYKGLEGCVLTNNKSCFYKIGLRINNLDDMKKIWSWLNEENVPDYMKINDYAIITHRFAQIDSIFKNGRDAVYWISKAGLKKFCKEHNLDYSSALEKVVKNEEDR